MKTLSRFITKSNSSIVAVLSCFDRVIFKGHLALSAPHQLEYFVDCVLKVRRSDFMKTIAPQYSDRLVAHARDWTQKAARNYVYRTGQFRKDEWAQNLIRDQGISEGLAGVLCTLETCPSFAIVPGPGRPQFVSRLRPTKNCDNSLSPRSSAVVVTPVSIRRGAKTYSCFEQSWTATISPEVFVTATSGDRCSATRE